MPVGLIMLIAVLIGGPEAGGETGDGKVSKAFQTGQRSSSSKEVFIDVIQAMFRQPKTNKQRRAAMVKDIRRRLTHTTFDKGELNRVLSPISDIEREKFVSDEAKDLAYLPYPLLIGYEQTISDAFIVAVMTAAVKLRPGHRVLDVGTGSGYQAAVASRLVKSVWSIEIVEPLASLAQARLKDLHYNNITVLKGDGFDGVSTEAPFDAIIVAAGARQIPPPLINQLKVGARLVMPIGPSPDLEELVLLTKGENGTSDRCSLGPVKFVPFTGKSLYIYPITATVSALRWCFDGPVTQ